MILWAALLLTLTLGLAASVRADITLTFTPHDGDKVSDIYKLTAKADSPDGIDKVEFLVDGQSRAVKNGTPYFFNWDTIADAEGAHTLTAIAYDSNGITKKAEIKLTIENELAMGAGPLAQKALDALPKKDYDTALKYARRSLKAEPNNTDGSRALAAVYASRENWDRANETLAKAKGVESSAPALTELANYKMQKAIQKENAADFVTGFVAIEDLRRKAFDLELKDLQGKVSGATGKDAFAAQEAVGDVYFNAGRYQEAATEYEKNVNADETTLSSANRLALGFAMFDHFDEALGRVRALTRAKKDDAITRAVYGLALLRNRQFAQAREVVQKDLAAKVPASLIVASYADSALGQTKQAVKEAASALELLPDAAEAHYAMALASPDLQRNERELRKTLALETFHSGPYLTYAANIALSQRSDRYDQALGLTDAVLKAEPENVFARIIQALVYTQQKQFGKAYAILNVLNRRETKAPDVRMAFAVYWSATQKGVQMINAMKEAQAMDEERFTFADVLPPMEYLDTLNRKLRYRSGFFLTPAALYPVKAPISPPADSATAATPAAP